MVMQVEKRRKVRGPHCDFVKRFSCLFEKDKLLTKTSDLRPPNNR